MAVIRDGLRDGAKALAGATDWILAHAQMRTPSWRFQ